MNEPLPLTSTRLESLLAACVDFAQRLIQTPSMPGEEGEIARLIAAELERLAFDRVWLDGAGNVCGRIAGREPGLPALVLNSHIDHVDPGDPALWPVPPYSGEIVDGHIVGRGARHQPLAVQVYALAGLSVGAPRRDVVFTVKEEVGGAGMVHWKETRDYEVGLRPASPRQRSALAPSQSSKSSSAGRDADARAKLIPNSSRDLWLVHIYMQLGDHLPAGRPPRRLPEVRARHKTPARRGWRWTPARD